MAAESDRAYSGGPIEGYYYQQSSFTPLEAGPDGLDITELLAGAKVEGQYPNHLDWFTVDLEGEKSAMDGWILEQHANYVVGAVHRVFHFTASAIYCAKEHALRVWAKSQLRGAPDDAKGLLSPPDALLRECCQLGSRDPTQTPSSANLSVGVAACRHWFRCLPL